jgi:hypothetical protein
VQYVDVLGLSKDAATTTTTASAPNATSFTITSDLAPSQSGFSPLGGGGGGYGPLNGGGNIPWLHTVYIAPDFSNLPYITSNWSQNDSTAFNWMDGAVTYQGGSDVPIHNTLLFYDLADRQMVGWFEITENGWYDQRFGGYGMFGDDLGLPGDQGWTHNDYVGVLMKSTDGKFFSGSFADNPRFNASEEYIGTHNISIGNEIQIVPEPSTGLLMGAGLLAAMLWTRFRYGSRHKED